MCLIRASAVWACQYARSDCAASLWDVTISITFSTLVSVSVRAGMWTSECFVAAPESAQDRFGEFRSTDEKVGEPRVSLVVDER